MIPLFFGALFQKLIPYLIGAAVVLGGLFMFGYYERGIGYASCKVQWDQAVANTKDVVRDAATRARDERVPDPFDSDKP